MCVKNIKTCHNVTVTTSPQKKLKKFAFPTVLFDIYNYLYINK